MIIESDLPSLPPPLPANHSVPKTVIIFDLGGGSYPKASILVCEISIMKEILPPNSKINVSLSFVAQVAEKLVGMGVDGELSQLVTGCRWVRREEIRAQLLKDSYKFSHTYLTVYTKTPKFNFC